jgi:phosphohistidine swiveling domain-containing protein
LNYSLRDALFIDGIYYYPEYHLSVFARRAVKHLLSGRQHFLHLRQETLKREKKILAANKERSLKTFFQTYLDYQPALALYHICDDLIEQQLRQALAEKFSPDEVDELMSHLNLPLQPNLDQLMKKWFLKTGDIDEFIKRYSWNFSRYGQHRLLSLSQARSFLSSLQKDPAAALGAAGRSATRQAIRQAKVALGRRAYYVDVMQFFVYYRTQRTDIMNKTWFSYYDRLAAFAKQLGISYADILQCSLDELRSGEIPDRRTLEARKKNTVVCLSHGKIKLFSAAAVDYFQKLCQDRRSGENIAGKTAFPGIVSGRVKIIKGSGDFVGFKPGDILVSPMTTPSMMPIMKKAAAFVTDEGGITCHAAILAREMKKPCVIGTKLATQVLRDGDLVEVDAGRGLIKIIKKS